MDKINYILELENLHTKANGTTILKGVSLKFEKNKVYAILGPNGSGKSTIAKTIMGFPNYKITKGDILFEGKSILDKNITERARLGIALAFQNPPTIKGVKLDKFICKICRDCKRVNASRNGSELGSDNTCAPSITDGFRKLKIENLLDRDINDGFSGGEMRRSELVQVISLKPKVMILDEPDSGLDYDSLRLVGNLLKSIRDMKNTTIIVITHSRYILDYLDADKIFIIYKGVKAYECGTECLDELEELGYEKFLKKYNIGMNK
ncbi:MAG: Fe-S cluster assembly ATPase SufC [Candidatus Odinarchaeia archaeon]